MTKKIMFNDKYGLTQDVLDGRKTQTRRIGTKAHFKVGEIVAVAQRYSDVEQGGYPVDSRYDAFRQANWGENKDGVLKSSSGWNNKMFVRADLMPHQIRITNVRIERLQDISDDDCIKEGIRDYSTPTERRYGYSDFNVETIVAFSSIREAYAALIDSISGKGTWDKTHLCLSMILNL